LTTQHLLYLFLESAEPQRTFEALKTLGLTNRESEVLGWVAGGKSNEEAAAILGMGPQTVKKHLERIYDVLGVANRTEAAAKAHAVLREPASQLIK
ncbi:MAG: helix-turn-helix transcriptional regulator, partial [Nitrospira sp.]|nr:helix-turn-helix transcriptional regulator [Nitrospira sp.]